MISLNECFWVFERKEVYIVTKPSPEIGKSCLRTNNLAWLVVMQKYIDELLSKVETST
jgi:hypothetical protein